MAAKIELDWTPPAGMTPARVASWRAFYLKGLNPKEGGFVITPKEYRDLYIIQLGRCFICQTARGIHPDDPKAAGSQRLGVDHNHDTGLVRGLLCAKGEWSCNRIVGRYRDEAKAFLRGAAYLQAPPAWSLRKVRSEHPDASEEDILRLAAGAVEYTRGVLGG
jgi:hypothetical protein